MGNFNLFYNLPTSGERSAEGEEMETVCENGVCYKRPAQKKDESAGQSSSNQSAQTSAYKSATEERLRRAKELIDLKRKEKEEEAAKVNAHLMLISVFRF